MQHALFANVHALVRIVVRCLAVDADERQIHQRVLQPLALVQGDDLHAVCVRFQPQQLRVVAGIGVGDARLQPVEQAMQADAAVAGLLQQFAQLQVVGQAALAVHQRQQAFGLFSAKVGQHRQYATALPAFAPMQQTFLMMALAFAFVLHRGDGGGAFAQQHGG